MWVEVYYIKWLLKLVNTIIIAINNHMIVIQVQIEKNIIKDVLLDNGLNVNIVTK